MLVLVRRREGMRDVQVEEELSDDVEGEEAVLADVVVGEADDAEEDGEHGKTHELDGLASDRVHRGDGDPVTGNGTGADDDDVTDSGVVEKLVDIGSGGVSDGRENDGVVERQTVEGDLAILLTDSTGCGYHVVSSLHRGRTTILRSREEPCRFSTCRSGGRSHPSWPWGWSCWPRRSRYLRHA